MNIVGITTKKGLLMSKHVVIDGELIEIDVKLENAMDHLGTTVEILINDAVDYYTNKDAKCRFVVGIEYLDQAVFSHVFDFKELTNMVRKALTNE